MIKRTLPKRCWDGSTSENKLGAERDRGKGMEGREENMNIQNGTVGDGTDGE